MLRRLLEPAELTAAGFTDIGIDITRTLDANDLTELAANLPDDVIPSGVDRASVIGDLDGAIATAFIRACKP